MTNDLILGIASGILATISIFFSTRIFHFIIVPYLKSLFFDMPDISGDWVSYDVADSSEPVGFAKIVQRSRCVKATVTRLIDRQGKDTNKVFIAEGQFASGQLVLMFEDKDMKGMIIGCCVFKLKPDNRTLEGKTMYFSDNTGRVITQDFYLKR
jgi:predicted small secreted protein